MSEGKHLIVLDKVMKPCFIKSLKTKFPTNLHEVKLAAIYPDDNDKFFVSNRIFVPFSAALLINICSRILNRKNHPTMVGDSAQLVNIALSFPLLYKNLKDIKKAYSKHASFDLFLAVPFHKKIDEDKFPCELIDCLKTTMQSVVPFTDDAVHECWNLVDYFEDK